MQADLPLITSNRADSTAERRESALWSAHVAAALRGDLGMTVPTMRGVPFQTGGTSWPCSWPDIGHAAEDGSGSPAGLWLGRVLPPFSHSVWRDYAGLATLVAAGRQRACRHRTRVVA